MNRAFFERVRPYVRDFLLRHPLPEDGVILGSALVVGVGTGLAAVLFVLLVRMIKAAALLVDLYVGRVPGTLLTMTLAGFLVGLIVKYWASEVSGSGIPDVMQGVAIRGGFVRHRVAEARMVATSLTIGAGGSAGSEGPIVHIGASLGSTLGQLMHFSEERMRTLVAAGAAAGIAAVFNAPIAGTIFAMEVVLNSFNVRYFGAVVISAVSASVVSDLFIYTEESLAVPLYHLNHIGELPAYAFLGLVAAVFAVLYVRFFYRVEGIFQQWRVPIPVKTALGMLLTGMLLLMLPVEFGLGQGMNGISRLISLNVPHKAELLLGLLLIKLLATSLTLGSGNSGGVFTPSLFMGALLGGAVGVGMNGFFPEIAPNPGAYALVGAAAVFAGAARGPITAVLIVFEISGDYQLILPLMTATVLSALVAETLMTDSIYTYGLTRRGINLRSGRDEDIMQSVQVHEVMTADVEPVTEEMTIHDLTERLVSSHSHGLPVVDEVGRLTGIVTLTDLDRALVQDMPKETTICQICTPFDQLLLAHPGDTMGDALARMGTRGLGRLPVVDPEDDHRLVGMIKRSDIIRAYNLAITRRAEQQYARKRMKLRDIDGTEFVDIKLKKHDPVIGRTVTEVASSMPKECILVSLRRHGQVMIPHGDTVFQPGDSVTAFVSSRDAESFRHNLCGAKKRGAGKRGKEPHA